MGHDRSKGRGGGSGQEDHLVFNLVDGPGAVDADAESPLDFEERSHVGERGEGNIKPEGDFRATGGDWALEDADAAGVVGGGGAFAGGLPAEDDVDAAGFDGGFGVDADEAREELAAGEGDFAAELAGGVAEAVVEFEGDGGVAHWPPRGRETGVGAMTTLARPAGLREWLRGWARNWVMAAWSSAG